jgi:hypothetical protein
MIGARNETQSTMGDGSRWVPEVVAQTLVPINSVHEGEFFELTGFDATGMIVTGGSVGPSLKLIMVRCQVTGSKEIRFEIEAQGTRIDGGVKPDSNVLNMPQGISWPQLDRLVDDLSESLAPGLFVAGKPG